MPGFIAGLAAVAVGGLAPAYWATRDWVRAVFLVLPAGLVVSGVAASLELLLPGTYLFWWATTSVLLAIACLRPSRSWIHRPGSLPPAVAVLVATIAPLTELAPFHIDWDARSIWFLHARLLLGGHADLVAGLTSPGLDFSHPDYPLAGPGAVALTWRLGPHLEYRAAQVVIGILTVAAVAAMAHELARLGRHTLGLALSTLTAVLLLIACYAPFDVFASDGYQDPLWSALAGAAVVAGLIAPIDPASQRVACLLTTAAAMTKSEGIVAAVVIVALMTLRYRLALPGRRTRNLLQLGRDLVVPGTVAGAIALWLLAKGVHHIRGRYALGAGLHRLITGDPAITSRFHPFWSAFWGQFHPVLWAALVITAGSIFLRRLRRDVGLGAQTWTLLVFAAAVLALIPAYLFDDSGIEFLIVTSVNRTMIFPYLLLLIAAAAWPISVARALPPTDHQLEAGTQ